MAAPCLSPDAHLGLSSHLIAQLVSPFLALDDCLSAASAQPAAAPREQPADNVDAGRDVLYARDGSPGKAGAAERAERKEHGAADRYLRGLGPLRVRVRVCERTYPPETFRRMERRRSCALWLRADAIGAC